MRATIFSIFFFASISCEETFLNKDSMMLCGKKNITTNGPLCCEFLPAAFYSSFEKDFFPQREYIDSTLPLKIQVDVCRTKFGKLQTLWRNKYNETLNDNDTTMVIVIEKIGQMFYPDKKNNNTFIFNINSSAVHIKEMKLIAHLFIKNTTCIVWDMKYYITGFPPLPVTVHHVDKQKGTIVWKGNVGGTIFDFVQVKWQISTRNNNCTENCVMQNKNRRKQDNLQEEIWQTCTETMRVPGSFDVNVSRQPFLFMCKMNNFEKLKNNSIPINVFTSIKNILGTHEAVNTF